MIVIQREKKKPQVHLGLVHRRYMKIKSGGIVRTINITQGKK